MERSLEEQRRLEMRLGGDQEGISVPTPSRALLLGGSFWAPSGAGPGLGAPAAAPAPSSFLKIRQGTARLRGRALPGPRGAPSLLLPRLWPKRARRAGARASAAFPGRADVNSFLPGGKEVACLHPITRGQIQVGSEGGWQAVWGEVGNVGPSPLLSSADPSPGAGATRCGRSSPRGLLPAEGGVHSPDLIAGAGAGRPLPRAPGARE